LEAFGFSREGTRELLSVQACIPVVERTTKRAPVKGFARYCAPLTSCVRSPIHAGRTGAKAGRGDCGSGSAPEIRAPAQRPPYRFFGWRDQRPERECSRDFADCNLEHIKQSYGRFSRPFRAHPTFDVLIRWFSLAEPRSTTGYHPTTLRVEIQHPTTATRLIKTLQDAGSFILRSRLLRRMERPPTGFRLARSKTANGMLKGLR
jgi:hypothetical protein